MNSEFLQDTGMDAILTRATRQEYRMSSEVGVEGCVVIYFMDYLHRDLEVCILFCV